MNDRSPFIPPDITARKNAGLSHGPDYTLPQPLSRYTPEDHATWATLFARQCAMLPGRVCEAFLQGLERLHVPDDRVPDFATLNRTLERLTGWQIVAVPGLIPDDVFFDHLAERRFPVTWWLREPSQLDYLQEPDVFHDLFGHVPLLADPVFADFLQGYGEAGRVARAAGLLGQLARLYWYTVEFGLMQTPMGLRIYGAGIVSSRAESVFCLESPAPLRLAFDADRVLRTRYRIDAFQDTYFVVESFDALFAAMPDLTARCARAAALPELMPGVCIPGDQPVARSVNVAA